MSMMSPTCSPADDFGVPSDRHMACYQTMLWLADEHYLRFEGRIGFNGLDQVTLTERAFMKLVATTDIALLDNASQASLAAQLRRTLAVGTPYKLREALSKIWPDVLPEPISSPSPE